MIMTNFQRKVLVLNYGKRIEKEDHYGHVKKLLL
jgi:hypothetical protein